MKNQIKKSRGFTLSELLVVIAIIAILVVISIPVFAGGLESSNEETDIANMRAAKSVAVNMSIEGHDLDGNIIDDNGIEYYFDISSGILTKDMPECYGQGTQSDGGCETFDMVVNPTDKYPQATYTSELDVTECVIKVYINAKGTVALSWYKDPTFKPKAGSNAYAMTESNRSMIGYKDGFEPTSEFTSSGEDYYFDSIESNAYSGYSGIVYIPASVTKIAIDAFDNVSYLKKFVVEEGNQNFTTIENGKILASADETVLVKAITNYWGNGNDTCTVPEGVTDIGNAFKYNKWLDAIVLPSTMTVLRSNSLTGLRSLRRITVIGGGTIPSNFLSTTGSSLTVGIGDGVTRIENKAFSAYGFSGSVSTSVKYADSSCFYLTKRNSTVFSITFNGKKYTSCGSLSSAVSSAARKK